MQNILAKRTMLFSLRGLTNFVKLTLSIGFRCLLVQGQPKIMEHYSLHSMLDWSNMFLLIMSGSLSHWSSLDINPIRSLRSVSIRSHLKICSSVHLSFFLNPCPSIVSNCPCLPPLQSLKLSILQLQTSLIWRFSCSSRIMKLECCCQVTGPREISQRQTWSMTCSVLNSKSYWVIFRIFKLLHHRLEISMQPTSWTSSLPNFLASRTMLFSSRG